jgi:hypothetical protein
LPRKLLLRRTRNTTKKLRLLLKEFTRRSLLSKAAHSQSKNRDLLPKNSRLRKFMTVQDQNTKKKSSLLSNNPPLKKLLLKPSQSRTKKYHLLPMSHLLRLVRSKRAQHTPKKCSPLPKTLPSRNLLRKWPQNTGRNMNLLPKGRAQKNLLSKRAQNEAKSLSPRRTQTKRKTRKMLPKRPSPFALLLNPPQHKSLTIPQFSKTPPPGNLLRKLPRRKGTSRVRATLYSKPLLNETKNLPSKRRQKKGLTMRRLSPSNLLSNLPQNNLLPGKPSPRKRLANGAQNKRKKCNMLPKNLLPSLRQNYLLRASRVPKAPLSKPTQNPHDNGKRIEFFPKRPFPKNPLWSLP